MPNKDINQKKNNPMENEELFHMLAEHSLDALIIGDLNGKYIYTSPSMKRIFGYELADLVDRNAMELFHPEDLSANVERMKMLAEGKNLPLIEFRFRKKNGDYVWCETAIKAAKTKQGDNRLVIVARDISERRKMQEELKKYSENLEQLVTQRTLQLNKTKEYLQQLVNRLPVALIAWDKEFNITTWNPEATEMFGFSESEFAEKGTGKLFSSKQSLTTFSAIWERLQRGEPADIEWENITKEGKSIVCSWVNTPLKDENGNLEGVLSMVQDLTERRTLEKRLKEITYSLSGVKAGESYLTSSLQRSLKIAFDLCSHGTKGLFLVREDPDMIVKDYNFKPEDIVLISLKPIRDFKAVSDLQQIAIILSKFIKDGGGVVVLGGLEYLISRFGFNPVFILIQEKRFEILETGGTLLIPVNMETLDNKEKGLLNSELKFLD